MWIELPDEIENYIVNIKDAMSIQSLALNTLFDSMLKGQHIVFATRKLLNIIEKLDYVNPSNRDFIGWIKQHYVMLYEGRDILEYKIVVTVESDVIEVNSNIYMVPLIYFCDFRESKLLTENESDGRFFIGIYNFVKNNEKTSSVYDVKLENDSCHGANVSSKILQSASDNRIAVCILDSDREMKNSATGATYKGANNSFKKVRKNHIIILRALGVREKENLFPPKAYMLLRKDKNIFLTVLDRFIDSEKIIKYFDIKDGVKYKKYNIKGWEAYYKDVILELKKEGLYKLPTNDEINNLEFICLEGVGEKICNMLNDILLEDGNTCEETLKKSSLSEDNKREIRDFRNSLQSFLPEYIYEEWKQIHKLLFSWGCCISKKSLPNYKL